MSDSCPLGICDGSGKFTVETADAFARPIGNGLSAKGGSISSSLCPCRRDEEPREGSARWWESEEIFRREWQASVFSDTATITIRAEVPISEDNHRLVRRGNRYYPTSIDLDFSDTGIHFVSPDEARELAALLVAAADAADAIDEPCADECGHWFPCDCRTRVEPEGIPF